MVSIIGHRGGLGLWPENTIAGFLKAAALGVDFVELDVHLSSDGEVIVIHVPTLDRTTLGTGTVVGKTAEELTRVPIRDAGGECLATLDTVLATLAPGAVRVLIELKTDPLSTPYPDLEAKVIDLVEKHGMDQRVRYLCFVPEVVERVRELRPEASVATPFQRPTLQMLGGLRNGIRRFQEIPGCIINVERPVLEHCYDLCLELIGPDRLGVGKVHTTEDLRIWLPRPLTQLATDFPDRAVAVRRELELA